MLYEAIFLSVMAGWLAKGKISNLAKIKLYHVWLVFLALGIQVGMDVLGSKGYRAVYDYRLLLYGVSYVLLFVFLGKHRRLPGILLLVVGFALNFLVIIMNGGAMPVTLEGLDPGYVDMLRNNELPTYRILDSSTRMPWLADVMICPWPKAKAFSIGDVFISLGVFWLVFKTMISNGVSTKLTSVRGLKM